MSYYYHNDAHSGMMDEIAELEESNLLSYPRLLSKHIRTTLSQLKVHNIDMYTAGFVYYLLRRRIHVPRDLLKQAKQALTRMIHDPAHLQEFRDPSMRKKVLQQELRLVEA